MSFKPIPIAVMGLGWVGTNRHIKSILRNKNFHLIGVIDRNPDRARAIGKELNLAYADSAETLRSVSWLKHVSAITVATPPHSHYRLVSEALSYGLDVLTEKPFAIDLRDGEEMARIAEKNQRVLAVVHNFQFSESATRLIADIKAGKLGRIRRIHAVQLSNPNRRLPSWYESLPGGLFYDESPHLLYLLRRLSPVPLKLLQSTVTPSFQGKQTPALVTAQYTCNCPDYPIPVTLDMHFESPVSEWHLSVLGEKAAGVIDLFRDIYLKVPNDGLHTTSTVLRTSVTVTIQHWLQHFTAGTRHLFGTLDYGNNHVYQRFAHAINTREPLHEVDPVSALDVMRMQHEILRSEGIEK